MSAVSDDTVFYDANDDTPYFQAGTEPPHARSGKLQRLLISIMSMECCVSAINWTKPSGLSKKLKLHLEWTTQSRCGSGQMWELAKCHVHPPEYPTRMVEESGTRQPAASHVHHKALFQWIVSNLSWLSQYDTVYVFVDNRELSGESPPDYWPYFAPWIKGRCEIIGPYQEKTTAVHIPSTQTPGWIKSTTLGPVPQ